MTTPAADGTRQPPEQKTSSFSFGESFIDFIKEISVLRLWVVVAAVVTTIGSALLFLSDVHGFERILASAILVMLPPCTALIVNEMIEHMVGRITR